MADRTVTKAELVKQAETLGIEVDGRWGKDRLQEEVDAVLTGEPQAGGEPHPDEAEEPETYAQPHLEPQEGRENATVADKRIEEPVSTDLTKKTEQRPTPVELLKDYWGEDGKRHKKGATIYLATKTAKTLIQSGKAERNDPLPGEED